jgi:hypothetical protein
LDRCRDWVVPRSAVASPVVDLAGLGGVGAALGDSVVGA